MSDTYEVKEVIHTGLIHNGLQIEIRFLDFPVATVGGMMSEDKPHNRYLVLVNTLVCPLQQRFSLGHELAHVYLDHLDQNRSIKEIEREANANAWKYYRLFKAGTLPTEIQTKLA